MRGSHQWGDTRKQHFVNGLDFGCREANGTASAWNVLSGRRVEQWARGLANLVQAPTRRKGPRGPSACHADRRASTAQQACGEGGSAGSTVVENRDPGRLSLTATYPDLPETRHTYDNDDHTFHLYEPWSLRGHGGYPPPGAVAVCGEVKDAEVRPVVTAEHPQACRRCTSLFEERERARIENREFSDD